MSHRSEHFPELPAPPGRILAFAGLALAAGLAVAYWIDRPRGPECVGFLAVHNTQVTAREAGTIASFAVSEGTAVRLGDPLLTLKDDQLERSILAKRREIAACESQLARTQAEADLELKWRMRTLESEICEIQLKSAGYLKEKFDFDMQKNVLRDVLAGREIAALEGTRSLFQDVVLDQRSAAPKRFATVLQMEAVNNAAEVSAAQVEICEQREQGLRQLKQELPSQIRKKVGVDVAEANLAHAREELAQLESRQENLTIVSPAIGTVGVFHTRQGEHLEPGTPIVDLLDATRKHLVVHVPSRDITRFSPGAKMCLRFPGGVTRCGEITSVAPQALPGSQSGPKSDPIVLVQVEPTGSLWPDVPTGSQVLVHPAR